MVDHLDHSANEQFVGGKLGVDVTGKEVVRDIELLDDNNLLSKMRAIDAHILGLKQYMMHTANPYMCHKRREKKALCLHLCQTQQVWHII